MKPMPALDALLTRAVKLGVFGTKMRSFINLPAREGIAALVTQQFDVVTQLPIGGEGQALREEVSQVEEENGMYVRPHSRPNRSWRAHATT
jgi:fructose-bisphosphate aldolase, class I